MVSVQVTPSRGYRLYLVSFNEPVRPPVSPGAFRREIPAGEPIVALVEDLPGWENEFAAKFGTIPSRVRSVPLMNSAMHPGRSYCTPASRFVDMLGSALREHFDSRIAAIRVRLGALEVRVSLTEAALDATGRDP